MNVFWKIVGLFVVVFAGYAIGRTLGFSDVACQLGGIIGAGAYILLVVDDWVGG